MVCLDTAYFIENWKHYNKIIFKYLNNFIKLIFNKKVTETWILWVPWTMYGTHWYALYTEEKSKITKKNWYALCTKEKSKITRKKGKTLTLWKTQSRKNNSYDSQQRPSLKNWWLENSQSICTILSQTFFFFRGSQPQKIKIKIKSVPC